MYEFLDEHWFIAWCALWLVWGIIPLVEIIFRLANRILRTIKVIFRGWPPEHLDADGDFRSIKETQTDKAPN